MNVQYLHGFTRDLVEQPIRISNERNRADHRPLHDRFSALRPFGTALFDCAAAGVESHATQLDNFPRYSSTFHRDRVAPRPCRRSSCTAILGQNGCYLLVGCKATLARGFEATIAPLLQRCGGEPIGDCGEGLHRPVSLGLGLEDRELDIRGRAAADD